MKTYSNAHSDSRILGINLFAFVRYLHKWFPFFPFLISKGLPYWAGTKMAC